MGIEWRTGIELRMSIEWRMGIERRMGIECRMCIYRVRVGNVLIFEKNDCFVKKTSRKIGKRNDRF